MRILVSLEDQSLFGSVGWRINNNGYVVFVKGGHPTRILHREIMSAPSGMVVDHINGDKLDNRRSNLRVCTIAENLRNRRMHKNNRLGVKGVYLDARPGRSPKYIAQIAVDGKQMRLGAFETTALAQDAYQRAAKKYHGEFARLS